MTISTIEATIQGVSPLLMHAFPLEPIEAIEKKTPEEQARITSYIDPDGMFFVPGVNIQRSLVSGASYSKGKGRSSMQKPLAACLLVSPERLIIHPQMWTIDSRPVVMPSTRGRIIRHRIRFDRWEIKFDAQYDPDLITATQLRRVVDDTGSRVGVLDFRPEKKGPFGRFMVTQWRAS